MSYWIDFRTANIVTPEIRLLLGLDCNIRYYSVWRIRLNTDSIRSMAVHNLLFHIFTILNPLTVNEVPRGDDNQQLRNVRRSTSVVYNSVVSRENLNMNELT